MTESRKMPSYTLGLNLVMFDRYSIIHALYTLELVLIFAQSTGPLWSQLDLKIY